jgi:hypothetical protein
MTALLAGWLVACLIRQFIIAFAKLCKKLIIRTNLANTMAVRSDPIKVSKRRNGAQRKNLSAANIIPWILQKTMLSAESRPEHLF